MADFNPNPLWGFSPQTPEDSPTWWGDVSDNLSLVYAPLSNKLANFAFPKDENYTLDTEALDSYPAYMWEDLFDAESDAEFANIVKMNTEMSEIRKRLSINNSVTSMLMAGLLDPINLVPIPGAIGMGFIKAGRRAVPAIAGLTSVQETWRAHRDPTHTGLEAVGAIAGSAFFGGLLTGTIGHLTRGMNVGKIGSDFEQAMRFEEGLPSTYAKGKKGINGHETIFIKERELNLKGRSPLEFNELINAGRPKGTGKPDPLSKVEGSNFDESIAPVALGYEKTANIGVLARLMTRFGSPIASRNAQKLMSDMGVITRNVKEGGVAIGGEGSVLLNDANWIFARASIVKKMQDDWTKYKSGRTTEPARLAGMPIAKWLEQVNQFASRDKSKYDFETYSREVFRTIARASDKTRTVNKKSVDYGKIIHESPDIEASANFIAKELKKAGDAGEEAGIFRTEDGIKKSFQDDIKEYTTYYMQYLDLNKIKNLTPHQIALKRLNERFIVKLLNDMEEKEIYVMRLMGKKQDAGTKVEEILETIAKRKEENVRRYKDLINEEIMQTKKKKNLIGEIEDHIKQSLQDQKDLLSALDSTYHTRGLTKDQLELRNTIIKRLFEVYGLQDVKAKPIKAKGTAKQEQLLKDLNDQIKRPRSSSAQNYMDDLLRKIDQPASESQERYIANLQKTIEGKHFSKGNLMAPNEAHYLTRIWNEGAIRDNYDSFVKMIMIPYLEKSPSGKLRRILETKPEPNATKQEIADLEIVKEQALKDKAQEITNKLINESGDMNFDNMHGKGQARFFMKRDLDMPNYHLLKEHNGMADFIETDIRAVTSTYFTKFGPSIEMAKMFKGDRLGERMIRESIYDVALRSADEINAKGLKTFTKKLMKYEDDFNIAVDATLGRIGNPATNGSASNQLVKVGMQLAQMAMMGKVVIASLADPAKIILSRGMRDTFGRYFKSWAIDLDERGMAKAAKVDLEVTSEAMNVILNTARYRIMQADSMGNYGNRKLGKLGDKATGIVDELSTGFYNMNLLNSWTDTFKGWVGIMSADRILRSGARLADKKGGPMTKDEVFDLDILRQYGLSQEDLIVMHKAWKKAKGKRGKEIYYSNVQEWGDDVDPDIVRKYITAIRADQINTIITPTNADKAALAHGIVGRGAQRRQHNLFKMPIQFMSWSFAANNKIIISSLQGRNKGQMSGMVAMVALGFMSDYLRNPSYWKQKDWQEKIVKGVEYSGLTSYWLDISNTIEIMSDNKFGIRPMLGSENPFAGDLGDTVSEPFGPLGSMGADVIRMLTDSKLTDNRRASIIRRLMPYNNLFYADWLFKGAQKNIMGTN